VDAIVRANNKYITTLLTGSLPAYNIIAIYELVDGGASLLTKEHYQLISMATIMVYQSYY